MSIVEQHVPRTPPQRRLLKTDVPGVYKRGNRYVAITQFRGGARRLSARPARGRRVGSRSSTTRSAGWSSTGADGAWPFGIDARRVPAHLQTYVIPFFRGRRIGDMRRRDVKEFIDYLIGVEPRHCQRGATWLAPSTIRRILAPLKAMLAEAYELEVIDTDAANVRIVVPGDSPRQGPRTLTAAQIDAIIERLPTLAGHRAAGSGFRPRRHRKGPRPPQ